MSYPDADGRAREGGPMVEINITPLVDVMLVLVIIFLITAPLLTRDIALDLPRASTVAAASVVPTHPARVVIEASGAVLLDGRLVNPRQLERALVAFRSTSKGDEARVRIRASDAVDYGVVARTLAIIRSAGIRRIGFVDDAGPGPAAGHAGGQ